MSRGRTVLFAAFLVVLVSHPTFGGDFESLPMPEQVSKLIKSGGMGGPLDPTGSNYTAEGNASMYSAMSAWNAHDWDTGVKRLKEHVQKFPDDPWAAEATLHLGCHAFYTKDYTSAENYFKSVISKHDGQAVGIKALVRLGPTYFMRGRANEATEAFAQVLKQSQAWDDRTYSHNWIREISMAKAAWLSSGNYSECGRDSLRRVFEILGDAKRAEEVAQVRAATFEGFTMEEVRTLSERYGHKCWGVTTAGSELSNLPVPFIARYGSNHFVTVTHVSADKVWYYDPFGGDKSEALQDFAKAFAGQALLFSDPSRLKVSTLTDQQMATIRGACCGAMATFWRDPDCKGEKPPFSYDPDTGLSPTGDQSPDLGSQDVGKGSRG